MANKITSFEPMAIGLQEHKKTFKGPKFDISKDAFLFSSLYSQDLV